MSILAKDERFNDTRNWRGLCNKRSSKEKRRDLSKMAASQWKDLKKDKRFALAALAATYLDLGYSDLKPYFYEKLHAKKFDTHPAIPSFAFLYAAAHPSQTDPSKIACYPTFADAKRGREIVMAPGRFFAAIYPDKSPQDIQRMAEKYACAVAPAQVHFAKSEDDFARVYASARGFSSCMAGEWDGDEECNPVRFYAHPENDLALAYLTHNNKPGGETVARSIVNTANKCYVRIYGDARLSDLLTGLGYAQSGERALRGQKCHARQINGDLVAPYLDAIQRIRWDDESDTCMIHSDGNYDATQTDGTAKYDEDRMACDHCGDYMDDDDSNYSDYHDMTVCDHCVSRNFTFAIYNRRGHETWVRDDEVVTVNGQAYLDDSDVLSHHNCVQDEDGDWQDLDDCVYLEYLDEYVLVSLCTRLDIPYGGDEYARSCDVKTVEIDEEEKTVHEDYQP